MAAEEEIAEFLGQQLQTATKRKVCTSDNEVEQLFQFAQTARPEEESKGTPHHTGMGLVSVTIYVQSV